MHTFETSDTKEVRHCRIAQFNGRAATVRSGGVTVTGVVRSIIDHKSCVPARWTITIVPTPPKARNETMRPSPRVRPLLADFY